MIAYVDASVLLRVALRQADALPEWRHIERGVASALIFDREPAYARSAAVARESFGRRSGDAPSDHPPAHCVPGARRTR